MRGGGKVLNRPARHASGAGPAVIFVHGLGGASKKTWERMFQCFADDDAFSDWTLDCFDFPTVMFRLPLMPPLPGLRGIAEGLKTFIEERHGSRSSIALVAHSLGGLVARQFIVSELRAGNHHGISKLALIAVPSNGSSLASVGSLVSFRHRQLRRLARDDEALNGLNIDWEQLSVEENLDVRYVLGGRDRAVPHDSAVPFFGRQNKSMLISADHASIIQPKDIEDIRYKTIRRFIKDGSISSGASHDQIPAHRQSNPTQIPLPSSQVWVRTADPLFDVYTPLDEPFYVARSFDNILLQALGSGNVWLVGNSGVGKSAALRRVVYQNGWHLNHISLAAYEISTATQLFRAMCIELGAIAHIDDVPAINQPLSEMFAFLKRVLREFSPDLIITNVIEEMPVDCDVLADFAELIVKFLGTIIGEIDLNLRVQFALSSLLDLTKGSKPISEKARERIHLIPLEAWSYQDLARLVVVLGSTLGYELSPESQRKVVAAASGSPRFVKQIFRLWRAGMGEENSLDELIERVRSEQVR